MYKIVYIFWKISRLIVMNKKFCILNIKNFVIYFKNCVCWIYIIHLFWKNVYVERTKFCTFFEKCVCSLKFVYVEYIELWTFFKKKVYMLNIQNYVHSLKNCVCWIYRFVLVLWKILYLKCTKLGIFFEKLCMFNIHNFYILWKIVNVQCTKLSTFFLKKSVYWIW